MTVTVSGTKDVRIPERLSVQVNRRPGHVRRTSAPTLSVPSCNVALLYLDVLNAAFSRSKICQIRAG